MSNSYTLGKNGKFGEIDFSKLRSGITKEELGIQEGSVLDSIWKRIDTNQEGDSKDKLDRQELNQLIKIISELCGKDTNLSTGEAKNFATEDGKKLGSKHQEELLTFLSKLSELTKGVAKVETETATNVETITYADGHTEKVKPDGSKTIISKDGKTITEKDADGNTTKETVKTDDSETVTEYELGSTNPKKQTKTNKDSKSVILYSQGKPIKQTTTIGETGEVQEFDFVEEQPVLRKTTNPKNGETVVYSDGKPASKSVTTETEEGTRVSNTVYDGNDSTEIVSINGKERYQKKVIDGREYEVSYDENGNTTGVIVQNGESVKAIAEKFGVKPEDLVKANAHLLKGGKHSFNAGDEIVIPRKMQADEYVNAQEGRKDVEGAKADYRAAVARRRAEAARREAEIQAKIGTEIARGQNGYYVTKTSDGNLHYWNPQKKEISADEFKKCCPTIYKNVTEAQRGATQKTRKKYDTATIKKQSGELAQKIHDQISGASRNENTINMLRGITPENAAFVVSEYQRMYGVSLAQDIDDEWGLDLNTVKEHICKKLVDQAKSLGIKGIDYGDYQKINDLKSLQTWINNASSKIINTMSNATETYYATEAEETQRQQSAENAKTAKASAEQIVNDLIKHTSGWNDVDKIKAAIARIDNPEELKEVNRLLTIKGYPPTDKYSPIENFIYQEANHSAVHTYNSSDYLEQVVQGWIDNGTLKGQAANEAQARMAARVLYDGGDGFGTDCDKIKKAVRMIKCPKPTGNREADNKQAREVYRLVNEMIKKHNTFYGLGSTCTDLLDYCKGEMWDSEVKYLNGILAETNAIQGEEKAQAVKDLTQEAVEGAGTDIEYLEQAIRGIDSPEDRKAIEAKLKEYCQKKGIEPKIAGQSYLQAILYDECDTFMGISTDHKEIRKFNEMLISQGAYTEEEIVNLRAEQAALQILEGNFDNIKDAVEQLKDPEVLAKVEQLLTTKGYKSLDEFLRKKLNQTKSDLVNAELASNNLLPNEKAADVAYRLIKNSDFNNRAQGIRAIRNEAVAKLVDEKLKQEGSSLAKVMEQFNKEKAEYKVKADFWDGLGKFIPVVGGFAEDISDAYRTNTDGSDNMFVEMDQAQNLTPQQKAAYARTVKLIEQKLAQMEKDYKAALDSQGAVSWAVNRFCEHYGIGTTREEIEARIEHDKETVRLLKLAAEGKLGKMVDGKPVAVTFEEVFKERNIGTNFDAGKVEKVENQAQMLVAMNYAKTNIAACWEELENGLSSSDSKRLSVAIIDTLEKLSQMTGKQLSLAGYGYTVKDGIILDSNGKSVSVDKLRELANQLKQGLSDVAKDLLGQDIPLNTSSSKINEILEDAYNSKKESFKQEFKDAFGQDCPDEMVDDYISTIETGKMVVNMGVLIGAVIAAPFTGGGSLAVFAVAAGASLGLNALEHSTDANGWTNAEWTSDAEQAMWDGLLSALGMKVGMIADAKAIGVYKTAAQNMLKKLVPNITEKTLERASICIARVRAMGYEVSSDTIQSLAQMYCQDGEFNEETFVRDLLMSVAGNTAGHVAGTVGDVKGTKNTTPDANSSAKQKQAPPSHDKPKYIVPEKETPLEKATRNGKNPNEVAPPRSVGKLGPEKFNAVKENLANELTQITSASDPHLETLQKRIDALQNREQRRELQNMLNNKKAELNANGPKVDEPKVDEPKVDEPKAEGAKADEPKVDEPKVEQSKVDEPKADEPKVDEPKADEPKVEEPKVDGREPQAKQYSELDETLISKFPAEKQAKIKELYKENPELINKFLKETIIDVNGNTIPRFKEGYTIINLYNYYKENPELFERLYNLKATDINGNTVSRFNGDQLSLAIDAYKKNPEYVSKLLEETSDYKGLSLPKYCGTDLYNMSQKHISLENADAAYEKALKDLEKGMDDIPKDSDLYEFLGMLNAVHKDIYKQVMDRSVEATSSLARKFRASVDKLKRTESTSKFMKSFPDDPRSNMLYDKYLESEFTSFSPQDAARLRNKCKEINRIYGTKIILPPDLKEAGTCLKLIEQELSNFKMHSNGQAQLPPVLDFLSAKAPYTIFNVAYVELGAKNSINMDGMTVDGIKRSLRHELTHANDLKYLQEFPAGIVHYKNGKLDINKCKYTEDLRKIGLSDEQIEYAYENPMEFIAVASEGNLANCSPALRETLIDFGMPEWELKFQNPTMWKTPVKGTESDVKIDEPKADEPKADESKADEPKVEEPKVDGREPRAKQYSEMDENELFSEYQRLNNEFKHGGLNQTEKAARVKELQKIQKELETKGFSIEGDRLVKIKSEAPKSDAAEVADAPKSRFSAAELRQKLGKKLYKAYQKAEELIARVRTMADYEKAKAYIQANFNKFRDVMSDLIDKLEAAAKKAGLKLKKAVFGETGSKYFSKNDVSDFVNKTEGDPRALYQNLLNRGFESTQATAFRGNQAFISMYDPQSKALYTFRFEGSTCKHKSKCFVTIQANGSFTRHSDLRVDYGNDGRAKVTITEGDKDIYTRTMTPDSKKAANNEDDFAQSGGKTGTSSSNAPQDMPKGTTYTINRNTKIELANGAYILDFSDPNVIAKLNSLEYGETLSVGRTVSGTKDIRINNQYVSGKHLEITRNADGTFTVKDVGSTNGSKIYNSEKTNDSGSSQKAGNSTSGKNSNIDYSGKSDKYFDYTSENLNETNIHTRDGQVHPEDIGVGQWCFGGYQSRTSNIDVVDLRGTALFKANVAYNPKTNASIIKIKGIREAGYTRPSDLEIRINGKLSDADARELIKYLEDRIPNLRTMAIDVKALQKHTADFLNNKIGNANGTSGSHRNSNNVDPIKERAYKRFDKNATPERMPENGILNQNSQYVLNTNDMPALRLIDGTIVDLNSPEIKNAIMNLRDGEYLTLGRNGDFEVSGSSNISRHHIIIAKENGKIQLKDVSSFGNTRALSQAEREIRANAIRKFNKNSATVELTQNAPINPNLNYILDFTNLPKLRLYDGTIVDLNNPKYYSAIQHLKEGGFITLGRTGFADIGISSSNSISRHHIILTIQDGELIMKDVSANGGTYKVGDKNNSSNRSENNNRSENSNESRNKDNSYRSHESGQAHSTSKTKEEQIKEYKNILGIDENTVLTKDVIKKAYRKKGLEWHPDRHPDNTDECTKMMQQINEAYSELNKLVE